MMIKHFWLCIGLCCIAYSEEPLEYTRINSTFFKKDTAVKNLDEKTLRNHLAIFEKINNSSIKLNKRKSKISDPDTVIVRDDYGKKEYINLDNFGIRAITIDQKNIPRSIYLETSPVRGLTTKEQEYWMRTDSLPKSYCTITKEEAIVRASAFVETVIGEYEKNRFDSIYVSEISATGREYVVYFMVKIKNDIWDSRGAYININANTGEIWSYHGDGIKKHPDFNYVPKITKDQAIKIFNDERAKLNADVEIRKVFLHYSDDYEKYRWTWVIFGVRKISKPFPSPHIAIDSETGEILKMRMD